MNKNDAVKRHNYVICDYATNRKTDLTRHQNAKHPSAVTPVCVNAKLSACGKMLSKKKKMLSLHLLVRNVRRFIKLKEVL